MAAHPTLRESFHWWHNWASEGQGEGPTALWLPRGRSALHHSSPSLKHVSFQPPQLLLGFNEANMALFLSHERKKRAARSHALGTAGPGVGAPRVTKPRPLSRSSENRVPEKEGAAKRLLWGVYGKGGRGLGQIFLLVLVPVWKGMRARITWLGSHLPEPLLPPLHG